MNYPDEDDMFNPRISWGQLHCPYCKGALELSVLSVRVAEQPTQYTFEVGCLRAAMFPGTCINTHKEKASSLEEGNTLEYLLSMRAYERWEKWSNSQRSLRKDQSFPATAAK